MEADFVVVGAGSAGCAMAYRLAESGATVIVIEYGGSDAGPFIKMPGALSYPMSMARYDWGYETEPEPQLNNRRLHCPRGKVIGGSSSINGMVYVRGHKGDFDHWAEAGATGWDYAHVLPYYKRMERWASGGHGGDPVWRGSYGPLHVTRGPRDNPLVHAYVEAGKQAGYPVTGDHNGERQEGFGPMEATVWQGRRWSAADAYLRPALQRANCTLVRGFVEKVEIEEGRATGVRLTRGGKSEVIRARRKVVLSSGPINSPKLLMLSGIGDANALTGFGIAPVADRPGVGRNLQDHLEVYVQVAASQPITLYKYWNLLGKAYVGARWLLRRDGPGASNQFESCAFIRSASGVPYPDIQYHFLPIAVTYNGKSASEGHGFQVHVTPARSASKGEITLSAPDPVAPPKIRFNYMSAPDDFRDYRAAIRLAREVFAQDAFKPYSKHEILPGAAADSDDSLDDYVREHAESAYHPCGTCRMGRADEGGAVVDPEGRVIGVRGLRVADSSIFPRITYGNLNAPSIMTGEKIADHVLGKSLPSDPSQPWEHPDWRTSQR